MNLDRLYKFISDRRFLLLTLACIFCSFFEIFTEWKSVFENPEQYLFLIAIIIVISLFSVYFFKNIKLDEKAVIFLIFVVAFIFRLVYIQSTDCLVRQHDVGGNNGHMAYIMTFYNHKELPDTINWQYYQPPVWHYICALFLHIQVSLGVAFEAARENLQLISLFCSSAIMLVSYKLFKLFGLNGKGMVFAFAFVAFHPTFIILSGSINNDVLSLLLSLTAVYLAIKWYREPKMKTILLLALSIGFSMGVKLSGGLISLGVAILFAIHLFGKQYKDKIGLIKQFASFGVICVPIALWWQVRNFIKFDTPFTYIPKLSDTSTQYIGFRSFFERMFDFSSLFENGVYPARAIESKADLYEYYEYNIPLGALKSSVFGEYYIGQSTSIGGFIAKLLFWSAVLLTLISIVACVYFVVKAIKNKENCELYKPSELIFTVICGLTIIISYVKFCFDFAHYCTMDFRYIAMTVVFAALYIGLLVKDRNKNNKIFDRIVVNGTFTLVAIFAVSSLLLYGTLA